MEDAEVLDRLLRSADPARRLHADDAPRLVVDVADRLEHAERHRQRRGGADLAGRGLDEVGSGRHREQRGAADVVVGAELARLEDHLEVGASARLLDPHDLVEDLRVAAREEGSAVDHHVDLVGAELDGVAHVCELDVDRRLARGKRGRDRCDLHAGARQPRRLATPTRFGYTQTAATDGIVAVGRVRPHRLGTERRHLAGRVGALERRQVHHPDREIERRELRTLLDRALGELAGPGLERDRVDRADPGEPEIERKLEVARKELCLRHLDKSSPERIGAGCAISFGPHRVHHHGPRGEREARPDQAHPAVRALLEEGAAADRPDRGRARPSRRQGADHRRGARPRVLRDRLGRGRGAAEGTQGEHARTRGISSARWRSCPRSPARRP